MSLVKMDGEMSRTDQGMSVSGKRGERDGGRGVGDNLLLRFTRFHGDSCKVKSDQLFLAA